MPNISQYKFNNLFYYIPLKYSFYDRLCFCLAHLSSFNVSNDRNLRQIQHYLRQSNVFIHTRSHASWREMENDVNVTRMMLLTKQWRRRESGAICPPLHAANFLHVGLFETYRYKRTGHFFTWNNIGNWYVFSKYLDNYCRYQYCANDTLFRNISSILRSIFQDILPKKDVAFCETTDTGHSYIKQIVNFSETNVSIDA